MDGGMDGQMDGWTYAGMDGRKKGCLAAWLAGWMNEILSLVAKTACNAIGASGFVGSVWSSGHDKLSETSAGLWTYV
eukprot:scaffold580667_cov19-Prasinocladus_malaysianus.AAC.1